MATIPTETIRYARRRRAYTEGLTFTGADVDNDDALCEFARDVLAMDIDDAELALIAMDVEDLGYLCIGHIAAIANWIADQPVETPTFQRKTKRCQRCHRELHDPESIALGFGPECRKVVAL